MSSDPAFQTQYRQEFIATFEQHQSLVRETCVTETVMKGNTATFLVAGSGSASAVTRGPNGLIPARGNDNTQSSATLVEWHDLVREPGFNIFASQGNQREIMQLSTMAVINRKIDSDIITELNNATNDTGTAATASMSMILLSKAILGQNYIPFDGNVFAIISPGFEAYLLQMTEFSSSDFVPGKPIGTGETAFQDKQGYYRWLGVNWIVHPGVPGVGTSSEKCFMYHRNAIGHAVNKDGIQSPVGFNEEQDYSYARASVYMGSKLLQNSGVMVMNHDSSAFVAQ